MGVFVLPGIEEVCCVSDMSLLRCDDALNDWSGGMCFGGFNGFGDITVVVNLEAMRVVQEEEKENYSNFCFIWEEIECLMVRFFKVFFFFSENI